MKVTFFGNLMLLTSKRPWYGHFRIIAGAISLVINLEIITELQEHEQKDFKFELQIIDIRHHKYLDLFTLAASTKVRINMLGFFVPDIKSHHSTVGTLKKYGYENAIKLGIEAAIIIVLIKFITFEELSELRVFQSVKTELCLEFIKEV